MYWRTDEENLLQNQNRQFSTFFSVAKSFVDIVLVRYVCKCILFGLHFFCFKVEIKETQIDDRNCLRNHVNSGKKKEKNSRKHARKMEMKK